MTRPTPRPPVDEFVEVATTRRYTWRLLRAFPGIEFDEPRVRVPLDRVELLAGVLDDLAAYQGAAGPGLAMRDLAKHLRKRKAATLAAGVES